MELERLAIEVRPRSQWEAIDLGMLAARRWYVTLVLLFALPMLIVLGLSAPLFLGHAGWALLLVWWFKPLYERMPLLFLSRVIFEEATDFRATLRQWRTAVLPGLFAALTYRRLSPARSFLAPVLVLERLDASDYHRRAGVLSRKVSNSSLWLTVLGVHIEGLLALGLLILLYLFVPAELAPGLDELFARTTPAWLAWLTTLSMLLCIVLIGPFYVACGFMLYLNRRVELEAWDIEVGFRRLAQRLGVASMLLLALIAAPPESVAQIAEEDRSLPELTLDLDIEAQSAPTARGESKEAIKAVLDGADYNQKDSFSYPKWLEWLLDQEIEDEEEARDLSWLGVLLGRIAEVVIWVGAFAILIWLAYRFRLLDFALEGSGSSSRPVKPRELFGIALAEDDLPEDVVAVARRLWQENDQRGALSLLLRASLIRFVEQHHCHFREGDTEGDCLREVRRRTPDNLQRGFAELIRHWQQVAYAHRPVHDSAFDALLNEWQPLVEPAVPESRS